MKNLRPLFTVVLTIATVALGFATNAQAAFHWPLHRATSTTATPAAVAQTADSATPATDPVAAEISPIDHIVQRVLGPSFVEHANKALAMAGTNDPMFTQCVEFGLALRQELIDQPLVTAPQSSLVTADLSCPLCVLEAKRQDLALIQSGALAARVSAVRLRVRDIKKRYHMACGALVMDETDVAGQAFDLFSGLLGH